MLKSIIKIKDLSFKYNNKIIFNNLNIDIYEGTFNVIVGKTGSGKTTLAKILAGIYKGEGYINISGYLLNNSFIDKIRRNVSYCFNNDTYYDSVRDIISFPLESLQYTKNEINITIEKISKKFGIDKILDQPLEEITLSEKAKVLIAASLSYKPKIIILDNIFKMLSVSDKKIVLKVLKEYQKEYHLTIILLTNNLEDTVNCDNIILLEEKTCIKSGPPEEIYQDDTLEKLGYDLPFIVKLSHNLILYDLLDKVYLKEKEVLEELWP